MFPVSQGPWEGISGEAMIFPALIFIGTPPLLLSGPAGFKKRGLNYRDSDKTGRRLYELFNL